MPVLGSKLIDFVVAPGIGRVCTWEWSKRACCLWAATNGHHPDRFERHASDHHETVEFENSKIALLNANCGEIELNSKKIARRQTMIQENYRGKFWRSSAQFWAALWREWWRRCKRRCLRASIWSWLSSNCSLRSSRVGCSKFELWILIGHCVRFWVLDDLSFFGFIYEPTLAGGKGKTVKHLKNKWPNR